MTTYLASIPTHHESTHRSEHAAIATLQRAEAVTGVNGSVTMVVVDGSYQSRTEVYPKRRETYTS